MLSLLRTYCLLSSFLVLCCTHPRMVLSKCWEVRGCFEAEAATPSPGLTATLSPSGGEGRRREIILPRPFWGEGGRRPGEGDGRGRAELFHTYLASPPAQSTRYQEALERYRSKDYAAALAAARQAIEEDGNNASYRHIYGLTLAALQQFREAEENLRQAIALKPDEANFHYDYGYVLYQQKKYDQAVPV